MPTPYKYRNKRPTKAELVRQEFRKDPNASVPKIAKKYGMSAKNVYPYRAQVYSAMTDKEFGRMLATMPKKRHGEKPEAAEETNTIRVDAEHVLNLADMEPKEFNDLVHQITRGRGGSEPEPTSAPSTGVDGLLDLRASKYGRFVDVAATTQEIMQLVGQPLVARGVMLGHDQATSLYMIALKLARIANGDPHEVDNWLDIAGYATLVAERLSGKEPR